MAMSRIAGASVLAVASLASAMASPKPDYSSMWSDFVKKWQKNYTEAEKEKRFQIFVDNVDKIYEENAQGHSHKLGVTEFADLTATEFSAKYLGYKPALRTGLTAVPWVSPNLTVPDSLDWVAKGAVTPVKNQAQCGSCWAFSATGATEGAFFVASQKLVSISEEELVQCDRKDLGCNGGSMDSAFQFIKKNGGICSESSYPYTSGHGHRGQCKKSCSAVVTVTGHTDVPEDDEEALMKAVTQQPVSVGIEADKMPFQLYQEGVLDSPKCGKNLDHGVLIVGFGTSEEGKKYWKVKNSWGSSWGEDGYLRVARGKNMCGIASQPTFPTGAKAVAPSPGPGPAPPSPAPSPTPPPACHDKEDFCKDDDIFKPSEDCELIPHSCDKTCGCCDSPPKDWCNTADSHAVAAAASAKIQALRAAGAKSASLQEVIV